MKRNFPNLVKEMDMQVQRVLKHRESQTRQMQRGPTPTHMVIKMLKVKDKERILKAARAKKIVASGEFPQDCQLICLKELCRLEGIGKKYSKS